MTINSTFINAELDENENKINKEEKLDSKVSQLSKVKRKISERCEPTTEVNEFAVSSNKITLDDLVFDLGDHANNAEIYKQLKYAQERKKILPTPLCSIRRLVAYKQAKQEVSRWDSIVYKNRVERHLEFPLEQEGIYLGDADTYLSNIAGSKSNLEKNVSEILHDNKHEIVEGDTLTKFEKEILSKLTLKEVLERQREIAKLRAWQAHKEAKQRHKNKIKSKKYHRILKKEKLKTQLKEFEELKTSNPCAALEKLEILEKQRAKERFTLRHRSKGKWAMSASLRVKYDNQTRLALKDQLQIHQSLTQKFLPKDDKSEEEEEEVDDIESFSAETSEQNENFFLNNTNEKDELLFEYKKYWMEINKLKSIENDETTSQHCPQEDINNSFKTTKLLILRTPRIKKDFISSDTTKIDISEKEDNLQNKIASFKKHIISTEKQQKFKKYQKTKSDQNSELYVNPESEFNIDEEFHLDEVAGNSDNCFSIEENNVMKNISLKEKVNVLKNAEIDPTKFLNVNVSNVNSLVPDIFCNVNELDHTSKHLTIAEAFEDDDVIAEFKSEKETVIKSSQPEDVNPVLPGWGSWGGKGLKAKRKKKVLSSPAPARKDHALGNVIFSETKNEKFAMHQVSEIPFPFRSVADFEASIRQPLGRTWVPEVAQRKLILPNVSTKLGTIIPPMSEELLVKNKFVKNRKPDFGPVPSFLKVN